MGQAGGREDGELLAAHEGVEPVDGRNAGLNELLRVVAGGGVHGQAVDIHALFGQDLGAAVDDAAEPVEDAGEHILADAELHGAAEEADLAFGEVDAGGGLEELDESIGAVDLEHLAAALFAVCEGDFAELVINDAFDAAHQHQRAGDFFNGTVFLWHQNFSPSSQRAPSSFWRAAITLWYSAAHWSNGVYLKRPTRSRALTETIFSISAPRSRACRPKS